ncbi:hypothetical protein PIB30_021086 [Stylosanthes scabra]|uniref:Uncharacterized protein n=1 Tax=Stylosanthes scabra TaxID=79078 RepID=A0ABU6Y7P9_9FABA|nr:hypothetical protein [Stylosanthes scabra]
MSITQQDVAYQLGLRIDGEPVSGCISGWYDHYNGQTIEDMCLDLLGWRGYEVGTNSLGPRVRMWRMFLNGVDHAGVNCTPYADPDLEVVVPPDVIPSQPSWALVCPLLCFAIVECHQVDRIVMQLGVMQHIPLRPLNIDMMYRHDGR